MQSLRNVRADRRLDRLKSALMVKTKATKCMTWDKKPEAAAWLPGIGEDWVDCL